MNNRNQLNKEQLDSVCGGIDAQVAIILGDDGKPDRVVISTGKGTLLERDLK